MKQSLCLLRFFDKTRQSDSLYKDYMSEEESSSALVHVH